MRPPTLPRALRACGPTRPLGASFVARRAVALLARSARRRHLRELRAGDARESGGWGPTPACAAQAHPPGPVRDEIARRAAEKVSRDKEEFLSTLGHDLRNPLNAIVTSVEVLRRTPPDAELAERARDVLARQTHQLLSIMERMIDPSRARLEDGAAVAMRPRVGLIDDDVNALATLHALLERTGLDVCFASGGAAGVMLLAVDPPDVAIVDIDSPGLDGYDVARRSRAAGYRGRLIALSDRPGGLQRSLAEGFEAHLLKPVDPERLLPLLTTS